MLTCRICGEQMNAYGSQNINTIVSLLACQYLLHTVAKHWEDLEKLHNSPPGDIDAAMQLAEMIGWI